MKPCVHIHVRERWMSARGQIITWWLLLCLARPLLPANAVASTHLGFCLFYYNVGLLAAARQPSPFVKYREYR
ncbi:hypothetical protein F4805DRAFT_445019 [Annulohypoxylon moriforme]|nr:hypothetical protein F4805DRAFT_445019 [Annulohypoxylon moriforme]